METTMDRMRTLMAEEVGEKERRGREEEEGEEECYLRRHPAR
jgi:hypothetical protein